MPSQDEIRELRQRIDAVDGEILDCLSRRLRLASAIGALKRREGLHVVDPEREARVWERWREGSLARGLDPELARAVLDLLMDAARRIQA